MSRRYKIVLTPGEDGWIIAECPGIPGCVSQGRTRREALGNIREAIALALECYAEDAKPIPRDRAEIRQVTVHA